MDTGALVRDGVEVMIVAAVGAMGASAVLRLLRGDIRAYPCPACGRPTSRAYPRCRHCRSALG